MQTMSMRVLLLAAFVHARVCVSVCLSAQKIIKTTYHKYSHKLAEICVI